MSEETNLDLSQISSADLFGGVDLNLEVGDRPIPPPPGWWICKLTKADKEKAIAGIRIPKEGSTRTAPFLMATVDWVLQSSNDPKVQMACENPTLFTNRKVRDWPNSMAMQGRSRLSDLLKASGEVTKTTNIAALSVQQIIDILEALASADGGTGFPFQVFIDWQGSAMSEIFKDETRKDEQGNPKPLIHQPDSFRGYRKFPFKRDLEGNELPAREFKIEGVDVAHAGSVETVTIFAEPRAGDIKACEFEDAE